MLSYDTTYAFSWEEGPNLIVVDKLQQTLLQLGAPNRYFKAVMYAYIMLLHLRVTSVVSVSAASPSHRSIE